MLARLSIAVFAASLFGSPALANNGNILSGVADIPRISSTAPLDGCAKVQKGLINNGGFLLFTCEKLLPHLPISEHKTSFDEYKSILKANGWRTKSLGSEKAEFRRTDAFGCETHLDMTLWKDRSMNEPRRPASDRNAHRQIVFMARFYGSACDIHYAQAQSLARGYP